MPVIKTFLVGGAVRDRLLGLPVRDRDWVVIGSTPEEMLSQGYSQVGADFPVFLHPVTKEEYALARTERKKAPGYHGFECDFSPNVTLEEDLLRRDLTINAMALDSNGVVIDPFKGQEDLRTKTLKHVSQAFCEDPLRILRVARFAARFSDSGFTVANETITLMREMVSNEEILHLAAERIWQETNRALSEKTPRIFFEILRQTGALSTLFEELDALFGIPQPKQHHPEVDCGIHSLMALEQASLLSECTDVRFAALVHDLGKALTPKENWPRHHGHETLGLKAIKSLCTRLRTPKSARDLALLVCEFHTHVHRAKELKSKTLLKVLLQCDAFRRPDRFADFLLCCRADAQGRTGFENTPYPQLQYFNSALHASQTVDIEALQKQGFVGKELGKKIDEQRTLKIEQFMGEAG